jgi:hypothetical protein
VPQLALLACIAFAACQGSDPQALELVSLDPFGAQDSLIEGGGASSIVGYTSPAGSGIPTLRLVKHDAANPDRVEPIRDVGFSGANAITRLRVTDEAAVLVVDGSVRLVDLSVPGQPSEQIPVAGVVGDVAAAGRWVAAAVEGGVALVNRDAPATSYPFAAASTPTALLASAGGFLAFTATGYVVVDLAGAEPAFWEVSDPVLRDLRSVAAAGGGALAAGPAATPGRSRVLRLDLSDPGAPVVVRSHECAGAFVAFAWDGGVTSVIAVHGAGDDAAPASFHQGYLLREGPGGFEESGLPLPFWSQSSQPIAAHANRLFAAQAGGVALLGIR